MIKTPANPQASLKRRIKQFYDLLNVRDFQRCHQMIDPRLRHNPRGITRLHYENAMREFVDRVGTIKVIDIRVETYLSKPSALYEGRDFAVGSTQWIDEAGDQRTFAERWVRERRTWYTRSTGLLFPFSAS